jgi:subtilisin family serine protease
LIAAADECNKQGATVISMSLGCASFLPSLCRSSAEEDGFNNLDAAGVLSIAAAGNAGNTWQSFPASYSSVVSVAATTSTDDVAAFSQRNAQVELAAPGSSVESTVPMGTGQSDTTTIDGTEYNTLSMEGSFLGTASGALVDCGDGSATCTNANGKICLIERGTVSFEEKSVNCEKGGGVGAILFNNEPGLFAGTLGDLVHFKLVVVSMSQEDGQAIKALLASRSITGTLESVVSNYEYYDGTSMATPHVSGVAAKIWSQVPSATNAQVRKALQEAARIPGSPAGTRDTSYGYGIIDAEASLVALQKIVQVESMGIMA